MYADFGTVTKIFGKLLKSQEISLKPQKVSQFLRNFKIFRKKNQKL